MNKRIAFPFLFVLLFIASSCKSESKTGVNEVQSANENIEVSPATSDVTNAVETKENKEKDSASTENEKLADESNQEVENKVTEPKKKAKKATKKKSNVDPGILIEMGEELEEYHKIEEEETEEKEAKSEKPAKETKPEKEVKTKRPEKPEPVESFVGFPSHSKLDALLKAHVSAAGVVDYKGLKTKEAELDSYLNILKNNAPGTAWNRNQKLAFWINAYNAFTLKLILNNYPLKSITSLDGGKPWDVKWIKIGDQTLSLNNIENDIIRPQFNEPRIHFAVNCAAVSCPPLLNAAYKDNKLEQQLESQTKKFINNSKFNTLAKNEIKVSKIFEWYNVDFGDVASFVMRYADTTVKPSAKVTYNEYDWGLNGK